MLFPGAGWRCGVDRQRGAQKIHEAIGRTASLIGGSDLLFNG